MNRLDRLISVFSPKTAYKRAQYRMAASHFDSASRSYRSKGWRAPGGDVNTAGQGALPLIRKRSRDLVRNNPIARRAVSAIVNNTIGDGIIPTVVAEDEGLKAAIQEILNAHCDTTAIDAHGRNNLYGLQRLWMRNIVESGESLKRRRSRRTSDNLPLNFQIETLESEFLDDRQQGQLRSGNYIYDGIEVDLIGRRVAYQVYDQHPEGLLYGFPDSGRVMSDAIIHAFQSERANQRRGVPWLAAVMATIHDAGDYESAQLLKQKIAAMFVAFTSDTTGDGADINGADGTDPSMVDELVPGMFEHLSPGRDVKFSDPPKSDSYADHMTNIDHRIAAGLDITHDALTFNLSQVNFSSARMGRIEMNRQTSANQWTLVIPQICHPLEAWLRDAISFVEPRSDYKIDWTPPEFALLDPSREIPPKIQAIEAGLTSRQREIRGRGFEPEVIDRERSEDAQREETLGLSAQPEENDEVTE